jgi:hypothetical protein
MYHETSGMVDLTSLGTTEEKKKSRAIISIKYGPNATDNLTIRPKKSETKESLIERANAKIAEIKSLQNQIDAIKNSRKRKAEQDDDEDKSKEVKLPKRCAAELRDEALFKDPPPKKDCPICFLPMPRKLICCMALPPATRLAVPIYDYAMANKGLANEAMEEYYPCCGTSICFGCVHTFNQSGNDEKCLFCNSDRAGKTDDEMVGDLIMRMEANDAASICLLAYFYQHGLQGLQQDHAKAMGLYVRATDLGSIKANCHLAGFYHEGGNFEEGQV